MAKKKEPPKVHFLTALAALEAQWQALVMLRAEAQSTISLLEDILQVDAFRSNERLKLHLAMLKKANEKCQEFDNLE